MSIIRPSAHEKTHYITYVRIHTHERSLAPTIGHSQHMYTLSHLSLKFLCKGIEVQVSEFVRSDQNILHCGTRVALIPSLTPDTNPRKTTPVPQQV